MIDHLAAYKLNVLHLHLSDDQGWRLAIDALAAARRARREHGGRRRRRAASSRRTSTARSSRYAAERHVTVVPEFDMPAHVQAAVASYPELGAAGSKEGLQTAYGEGLLLAERPLRGHVPVRRGRARRAGGADPRAVPAHRRRRGVEHRPRRLPRVHGARAADRRRDGQAARRLGGDRHRAAGRRHDRAVLEHRRRLAARRHRRGAGGGRARRPRAALPRASTSTST